MKALKTCKTGCGKMKSGGPVRKVKSMAKGGAMDKPKIYGIPQTGTTNYSAPTMGRGGMVKKKMQNGGKVNYLPSKAAYEKSIRDMGGPDNPPVQLEPREIYKAKMDQKKRSVVNQMFPTTGIPKKGIGVKKQMAKGGSTFGMLSVKARIDKNPKPTAADRIAGAKMKMRKKK